MVGGGPLFGSLNLLIILWYIVEIGMYMYAKGIVSEQKSYGFKNLYKLETSPHENQNPNIQDDFLKFE